MSSENQSSLSKSFVKIPDDILIEDQCHSSAQLKSETLELDKASAQLNLICKPAQNEVCAKEERISRHVQSQKQVAISCVEDNEDYKPSPMSADLASYPNIETGTFMEQGTSTSMNDAQNRDMKQNVNQSQNETNMTQPSSDEIKLVTRQVSDAVDSKAMFGNITVMSSSTDANPAQGTFLQAQSIGSIQNLPEHTILSTTEIPDTYSDAFANDAVANAHYIVQQTMPSAQGMNQHDNTQVVLIQVPNSQNGSQMVMAHISNSQLQSANVPVTVTEVPSDPDPDGETEDGKKPRRTKGRGRTKQVKPDTSNTPLRPLAPRMFAVPISSPVLIAGPSGNSQVFTPVDQAQQLMSVQSGQVTRPAGQHFEVLGRCIMCFRFCRTTTYCRAEKNHTEVRAAACAECEEKGFSTVVCRRKKQHKEPNAHPPNIVINVALQRPADLKEMCLKNSLPPCFSELHSLTVHHADCIFAQPRIKSETEDQLMTMEGVASADQSSYRKPTDYARGYLYPYSKEAWDEWLAKFCIQTGTSYRIRTGKRVNKKSDHGLANHNGKIVVYRALETQLHNCALGGKPRRKALREGSRRRKARGSKLIGCSAVIHTRLVVTEEDWKALEITLPKLSAHLPAHNPRVATNELQPVMSSMILSSSLYGSDQGVTSSEQEEFAILGDVSFHTDTDTELTNDQMQLINSLQMESLKKQTKSLLTNCLSFVDEMTNFEVLKTANMHVQSLYNQLKTSVKRSRKRTAVEANLVDDEVLEEGESRPGSVNQVVLLQTDHD